MKTSLDRSALNLYCESILQPTESAGVILRAIQRSSARSSERFLEVNVILLFLFFLHQKYKPIVTEKLFTTERVFIIKTLIAIQNI